MFPNVFKKTFLSIALCGLLLISSKQPMAFVFATGVAPLLFAKPLKEWARKFRTSWHFLSLGIFFGMLTELAAIFDNIHKPPQERILLNPNPINDLFLGFFFYAVLIGCWYGLLRCWAFLPRHVFLLSGILGIFIEQFDPAKGGPVIFLNAISNPIAGIPIALLVACVYGIFPTLAYFLTQHTFDNRKSVSLTAFATSAVALFLQWAIYGIIILPSLKKYLG